MVEHHVDSKAYPAKHMLVIGGIASEWASWGYLANLKIGDRMFVGCIDGRAIFGPCVEIIEGSPI